MANDVQSTRIVIVENARVQLLVRLSKYCVWVFSTMQPGIPSIAAVTKLRKVNKHYLLKNFHFCSLLVCVHARTFQIRNCTTKRPPTAILEEVGQWRLSKYRVKYMGPPKGYSYYCNSQNFILRVKTDKCAWTCKRHHVTATNIHVNTGLQNYFVIIFSPPVLKKKTEWGTR